MMFPQRRRRRRTIMTRHRLVVGVVLLPVVASFSSSNLSDRTRIHQSRRGRRRSTATNDARETRSTAHLHVLSSKDMEEISTISTFDDDESMHAIACAINFDDIHNPFTSRLDSKATFVEFTDDGLCVPAGPVGQFKEDLANSLNEPIVEIIVDACVLMNTLLVAIGTLDSLSSYADSLLVAENIIGLVLAVEFLGRWFSSAKETLRFVLRPQFAIDMVVVVLPLVFGWSANFWQTVQWAPDWLLSPSALTNLKLLRLLRLQRVLQNIETFSKFERALGLNRNNKVEEWQLQLARVSLSLFTLLSVSTGMIYTAEHDVNPCFKDYFTALYFGLTTLTTVGFGDIVPQTAAGRFVVSGSIIAGVAILPGQAASLFEALLKRQELNKKGRRIKRVNGSTTIGSVNGANGVNGDDSSLMALDTAKECPSCGATLHWAGARFCYSCGEEL